MPLLKISTACFSLVSMFQLSKTKEKIWRETLEGMVIGTSISFVIKELKRTAVPLIEERNGTQFQFFLEALELELERNIFLAEG